MILSDFIGHHSFIQGNLQSEEDYYPSLTLEEEEKGNLGIK